MAINTPPLKWYQKSDRIYLTIPLQDVTNAKFDIQEESFKFTCTSQGNEYETNIVFYMPVNAKESFHMMGDREITIQLVKRNNNDEVWPRLLKDESLEKELVKFDFARAGDDNGDE